VIRDVLGSAVDFLNLDTKMVQYTVTATV